MRRLSSLLAVLLGALSSLGGTGCSADTSDELIAESNQELGQSIDVPNPSGAYFANVTANGSGCPAGTWTADISPDGKAFTVAFSAYEAIVNPGQPMQVK